MYTLHLYTHYSLHWLHVVFAKNNSLPLTVETLRPNSKGPQIQVLRPKLRTKIPPPVASTPHGVVHTHVIPINSNFVLRYDADQVRGQGAVLASSIPTDKL